MTDVLREVFDEDLDAIEIGAAILGTGGGGNPYIGKLRCREELKKGRKIPVLPLSELPDNAFVVSLGGIGSPVVGVEKIEEAVKAIQFNNVTTVQIIYNMFRRRPEDYFFDIAAEKNIGVIVRVPLASGLLSGKMRAESTFHPGDHRHGNRNGEWFDKGETFAGVPFEIGLAAVEELKEIFSGYDSLAQVALKWILLNPKVSVIIPGASKLEHIPGNMTAGNLPAFTPKQLAEAQNVYNTYIKDHVHDLW